MPGGEIQFLTDQQIRQRLIRGVDHSLRRELETELAWRAHYGRHCHRPFEEYVPAWLVAQATSERRR